MTGPRGRKGRQGASAWPFPARYAPMRSDAGIHPIDQLVAAIPKVATLTRRLTRLAEHVYRRIADPDDFVQYESARGEQQKAAIAAYFDAGWAYGELAGRAESLRASASASPAASALASEVQRIALSVELPRQHVIAVLLEAAHGLVLAPPAPVRSEPGVPAPRTTRGNA